MRIAHVAAAALAAAALAAPAAANPSITLVAYTPTLFDADAAADGLVSFEGAQPPGLDTARRMSLSPVEEHHAVRPFGDPGASGEALYEAPLNEFAGQRRAFEPGPVGAALGRAKSRILRAFAAD